MAPGARNFACPWETCGKSFNRKSDLCRHYRIHTNERPYHCNFADCMKSFIQRSALTVHSRTHTGEKPHVCDHAGCHKAFSDSSSLARHRRIHTGKRPYKCHEPSCDRSFCRKTTLTKHQNRSHQSAGSPQSQVTPVTPETQYPPPIQASVQPDDQIPIQQQQSQFPPQSMVTHSYFPPQTVAISQPIHVPNNAPLGPNTVQTSAPLPYHQPQPDPQNLEALRSMNYLSQFHPQVLTGIPQQNMPVAEGNPMMLYHNVDPFDKPAPRVFNHPHETDWSFLGVG